jgi:hypothetical protein
VSPIGLEDMQTAAKRALSEAAREPEAPESIHSACMSEEAPRRVAARLHARPRPARWLRFGCGCGGGGVTISATSSATSSATGSSTGVATLGVLWGLVTLGVLWGLVTNVLRHNVL